MAKAPAKKAPAKKAATKTAAKKAPAKKHQLPAEKPARSFRLWAPSWTCSSTGICLKF